MADKTVSRDERMATFLALVQAQDGGMSLARSRKAIAGRFGIGEEQVRQIERDGIAGGWPPLG
jgi:hypothetical protein